MRYIFLIISICGATTSTIASRYEATVLSKQGIKDYAKSFDTGVNTFKEMLRNNKLFVDNTLFIKEALTAPQSLYMLGPEKSGKTINLDMLKTFLEIQVDDRGRRILPKNTTSNYRLFVHGEIILDDGTVQKLEKPLLISKHKDLIDRYLGEYPVIYINFKEVKEATIMDWAYGIECCIKRAYEQHKYMINAYGWAIRRKGLNSTQRQEIREDWRRFDNILTFREEHDFLAIRIQVLCRMLYKHFKKLPIILYEDFDRLLSNFFRLKKFIQNHLTKVDQHMTMFQTWVFTHNDCFEKGFVMETFKPLQCPFGAWENYTLVDILLDNHPVSRYFGFDRQNVQALIDKHNLPAEISAKAHQWYGGFKFNQYCPYSIVSFLNSKRFHNYFHDEDVEAILPLLLLHHIEIRSTLLSFLSNETRKTTVEDIQKDIDPIDLCKLAPQIFDMKRPYDDDADNRFTWLLIRKGFLNVHKLNELDVVESAFEENHDISSPNKEIATTVPNWLQEFDVVKSTFDEKLEISLPNKEIATTMSNWLLSYYQHNYTIDAALLSDAATHLLKFVNNEASVLSSLERSLQHLFKRSGCEARSDSIVATTFYRKIEDPYHTLFTCAALKMQQLVNFDLHVTYNRFNHLDYVIYNQTTSHAVVLQVNHNDNPFQDILEAMSKRQLNIIQKLNHPKTVKFVVIKIWPNQTVEIHSPPNKT